MLPGSGVKLCVGRCGDVARDAEQGTEGVERIEPPVEAEGEFVEVGLQVLVTDPVMDAVQPRFQVCEDEMDDWQILLGDRRIAPFSDGEVFVAALGKAGVAAPVVGDERRARHNLVVSQLSTVERERETLVAEITEADSRAAPAALLRLRGIGPELASLLWLEGLFRRFDNRRQIAAYAGLAPSPWQSGGTDREQGITKAGNPRLRHAMVELAWFWVRHQPGSDLSRWFVARVGEGRGRIRRIAIVALARKLLVALWRYVTQGVVPQGAVFKA